MPAHLKRKRPPGGLESQPSFPVTATAPGPTVPRRATRQSSVPPLPVASDPEPRRRRPRRRADDTDGVPAESSPTIYSPRGKENIPMNSEQQHRQHLPAPSQVLKLTRLTRHSAGHDTGSAPRPSNTNVERAKPSHAVPRDLQVAPTSPAGTQRSLPPRATGTPAGSGRQPPVHHQQSVPVGRNKPIFMTTSVAQHKQLPTAAATTNGTPERAGRGTSTTGRTDRNIDKVVLGNIFFRAWYPSYYGKEVLGDISSNSQSAKGGKGGKPGGTTGAQYHEDDTNGGKAHGRRDRDHPPPMLDRLYVCPCCFKYSKELVTWWEHVRACERRGFVPGEKIYVHPKGRRTVLVPSGPAPKQGRGKRGSTAGQKMVEEVVQDEGEWSVWEVDGETDVLFCQNLSLFAKLFLDNKSVFFDVTGFKYYLLVYTPPTPPTDPDADLITIVQPRSQIVGFFSKEKMSWDNNNLACILIFPPWQRKGLGALLMGVSYEISRREGLLGGPEKPISDLGKKGYKRFWAGEIARWILGLSHQHHHHQQPPQSDPSQSQHQLQHQQPEIVVDITECSQATWIAPEDCLLVLREMGVAEDAGMGPPPSRAQEPKKAEENHDIDNNNNIGDNNNNNNKNNNNPTGTHGHNHNHNHTNHGAAGATDIVPEVQRVRISQAAVRAWVVANKISLERTCDPEGFVEGYAVKKDAGVPVAGGGGGGGGGGGLEEVI